jgi:hypothetical protein
MSANVNEIKKIVEESKEARDVFLKLGKQGIIWDDVLDTLIFREKDEKIVQANQAIMERLIKQRDAYDRQLYVDAAKNLFPNSDFTVQSEAHYDIHPITKCTILAYYTINVYKGADVGYNALLGESSIEIVVMAPGGRNSTSDIDTTISVSVPEEFFNNLSRQFGIKESEESDPCFETFIKVEIIRYFNNTSQKDCLITSSSSRDSNAYSDGFMRKKTENDEKYYAEYPKFNRIYEKVLTIGDPFFDRAYYYTLYNSYKRDKQVNEMIASLIPIFESLNEVEIASFKKNILSTIKSEFSPTDKDFAVNSIADVKENFAKVCQTVEHLLNEKKRFLRKVARSSAGKEFSSQSPFAPGKETENEEKCKKELNVFCMNDLYYRALKIVYNLNSQEKALEKKITAEIKKMKNALTQLNALDNSRPLRGSASIQVEGYEKALSAARKRHGDLKEGLIKMLKSCAKLVIDKQYQQIFANLFANEAYTNRSAPYHVVEGIQRQNKASLSKQAMMGSVLQQIGSKLIHMNSKNRAKAGEISYKTSKYGQRVGDIVFGQSEKAYSIKELIGDIRSGDLPILTQFRTRTVNNMSAVFTMEEYQYLNRDMAIVERIKNKRDIPDSDKYTVTEACFPSSECKNEHELLKSITQKTILTAYKARLKDAGALWGRYTPPIIREQLPVRIVDSLSSKNLNGISTKTLVAMRGRGGVFIVNPEGIPRIVELKQFRGEIDFSRTNDEIAGQINAVVFKISPEASSVAPASLRDKRERESGNQQDVQQRPKKATKSPQQSQPFLVQSTRNDGSDDNQHGKGAKRGRKRQTPAPGILVPFPG